MKKLITLPATLFTLFTSAQTTNKLHEKAVLVDTHNDCLSTLTLEGKDISNRLTEGHSDLYRWKQGGLDVQFFSIWTGDKARNPEARPDDPVGRGFFKDAMQEIDSLKSIVRRNPSRMVLAKYYSEVKKGLRQKKLVSLIGVEGGHMIEDDMGKLVELAKHGMRYMTITWNNSTSWASSAKDEASLNPPAGGTSKDSVWRKGLNEFGKQVVRMMNQLGVIVDLSHVGEQTFYDAIATTT